MSYLDDRDWSTAWARASAALKTDSDQTRAELAARRAVLRFRATRPSPGMARAREAARQVPQLMQRLDDELDVLRATAAGTPSTQPERRAFLEQLLSDLEDELEFDPDGPAARAWSPLSNRTARGQVIDRLQTVCDDALWDQLPPAPPRAPNAAFDQLIVDLGIAYTAATGLRPSAAKHNDPRYLTPFGHFVRALWASASDDGPPTLKRMDAALRRDRRARFSPVLMGQKGGTTVAADAGNTRTMTGPVTNPRSEA